MLSGNYMNYMNLLLTMGIVKSRAKRDRDWFNISKHNPS